MEPVESPPSSRRPLGRRLAAVGGISLLIVALAGAAGFALAQSESESTPQAAVESFLDDVADENLEAAVAGLRQAEAATGTAALNRLYPELIRLGILSDGATPVDLSGIDIGFSGLTYTVENVTAGLARVDVTGEATITIDSDAFALGTALVDEWPAGFAVDMTMTVPFGDDFPLSVAAVQQGGEWKVSLGHSLAERWRLDEGLPAPTTALSATGAASPEEAREEFWAAVEALDVEAALGLLAPLEGDVLRLYYPLVADDVSAVLERLESLRGILGDDFGTNMMEELQTVSIEGVWFVSVVDTALEAFFLELAALTPEEVAAMIEDGAALGLDPDSFFDGLEQGELEERFGELEERFRELPFVCEEGEDCKPPFLEDFDLGELEERFGELPFTCEEGEDCPFPPFLEDFDAEQFQDSLNDLLESEELRSLLENFDFAELDELLEQFQAPAGQ